MCMHACVWQIRTNEMLPVVIGIGHLWQSFLLNVARFMMAIVETGSASIFCPLGLPQCWGRLVQAASAGLVRSNSGEWILSPRHGSSCSTGKIRLQSNGKSNFTYNMPACTKILHAVCVRARAHTHTHTHTDVYTKIHTCIHMYTVAY